MATTLDPAVARLAGRQQRVGVLVLVDKPARAGPVPLAVPANLRRASGTTLEVCEKLQNVLTGMCGGIDAGGLAPLGLADAAAAGPTALENLGAVMGALHPAQIQQVLATPGVRRIVAMPRFVPLVGPLAYRVAAPAQMVDGPVPSLLQARVPALWDAGLQGGGACIGHLDTGINSSHPAFASLLAAPRLRFAAFDAAGRQIDGAAAGDVVLGGHVFHGTHTAGTLVGDAIGSTRIGVAPQARLVSVSIFPQPLPANEQMSQLVVRALNWIVGEAPWVINLSFGERGFTDSYIGILRDMIDDNIAIVAAVGNDGIGYTSSPGNYAGVISVGAVDGNDQVCHWSGSGTLRRKARPDLCAPGMDVLSAGQGDDAALSSGTSMAAPHVAAVLAAARARAPDLSPRTWQSRLRRSARVPANWDAGRGGAGVLDAAGLLSRL